MDDGARFADLYVRVVVRTRGEDGLCALGRLLLLARVAQGVVGGHLEVNVTHLLRAHRVKHAVRHRHRAREQVAWRVGDDA